jgi:uncharacterized membrane protein YgaE (UPF0421/DUF939 family)
MKTKRLASLKKALGHPARMALAASLAFLAAKWLGLLEAYWAPIAALIVVQSDSSALLGTSWLLLVGTALGASAGALLAIYVGQKVVIFALGVLGMGMLSSALRLDRRVNHFASVALIIVMLGGPPDNAWHRGLHRFIEFSVGIVMALLLGALWPEPPAGQASFQNQEH